MKILGSQTQFAGSDILVSDSNNKARFSFVAISNLFEILNASEVMIAECRVVGGKSRWSAEQLASTVAIGTAPLIVTSTTIVPNLNSQFFAGLNGTTNTKGQLIVSTGNALAFVNVGANDQVLTADSTQASGVKWAAAGGGSGGLSLGQVQALAVGNVMP